MMAMTPSSVPEPTEDSAPTSSAAAVSVSDVHHLLDDAVRAAGLVHLWVTFPCLRVSQPKHCLS